jgi:hypothetical protein
MSKPLFLCFLGLLYVGLCPAQAPLKNTIRFNNSPVQAKWKIDKEFVDEFQQKLTYVNGRSFIVIQFDHIPPTAERLKLAAAGIRLLGYIPENAFVAEVNQAIPYNLLTQVSARALVTIPASAKMAGSLASALKPDHLQSVWLQFFETVDLATARQVLGPDDVVISDALFESYQVMSVRTGSRRLEQIAASPLVEYISKMEDPVAVLNQEGKNLSRANILQSTLPGSYNLSGAGVAVGVYEISGPPYMHPDFAVRSISTSGEGVLDYHSTHVHGIVGGSGLLNPLYSGYAPAASLISGFTEVSTIATLNYHRDLGMVLTNNSYGTGSVCSPDPYNVNRRIIDGISASYPTLLHVFAAGNSGNGQCPRYPRGFNTVHTGENAAKSTLSVGNVYPDGILGPFSSRGPAGGGMLKPEIVATGSAVMSTVPGDAYGLSSGTSMAAPAVTGGLALLYERYRQTHQGQDPASALMKAILLNTATDLGNKGPDFSYGFGLMNLDRAVKVLDKEWYKKDSIVLASTNSRQLAVPAGLSQLKVMLYWPDPPATALSARALVNDLDLELVSPDGTVTLPLVLDTIAGNVQLPASPGRDRINTVEQILIDHPLPGNYTIRVNGSGMTQDKPQPYYVLYDMLPNSVQLTFPYGGEAFGPGEKITVQWDAFGNTDGGFELAYSADNGGNWSTIGSVMQQSARQMEWTVPDTISNRVLVRVKRLSDGAIHSSGAFTILGIPGPVAQASQCPGSFSLQWPRIKGADSYDILKAINGKMIKVASTTDSFYTINSLQEDNLAYVSVQANAGAVKGRRSVAIGRLPNTGNCDAAVFNNDLKITTIVSPKSGRAFTSTSLGNDHKITVRIKNSDDAPVDQYLVQYRIDDGPYVTESINYSIPPGGSYEYTFAAGYNFSAFRNYKIEVVVTNDGDRQHDNDSLVTIVSHLPNGVLHPGTPFTEDFEGIADTSYPGDQFGLIGLPAFDFYSGTSYNRLNIKKDRFLDSVSKALQLAPMTTSNPFPARLHLTVNLSEYQVAENNISFRFLYYQSLANMPKDTVWVRGNDQSAWLPIVSMGGPGTQAGIYTIKGIDLGKVLQTGGQDFSSSSQIMWTKTPSAGFYNLDNITLYNSSRDLEITSIDTPLNRNVGNLGTLFPRITMQNHAPVDLVNVQVFYQLDTGPVVSETIAHIGAYAARSYVFSQAISGIPVGRHRLRCWVGDERDTYPANNEITLQIINIPQVVTYPYVEDFEKGDGGFYAEGRKTSFAYGAIGYGNIYGAASGQNAWKTNLSGTYKNDEDGYLYSPSFDVSTLSKPFLSFSLAVNTDYCYLSSYCDALLIQYSVDGKNWLLLPKNASGYKYEVVQNTPARFRWQVSTTSLPRAAKDLRFRFYFRSDETNNYEGIGIDDFHIYDSVTAIYDGPASLELRSPVPAGNGWSNYLSNGKLVAAINPSIQDAAATIQVFNDPAGTGNFHGQYYLNRSFIVKSGKKDSFLVRLYIPDADVDSLLLAQSCATCLSPRNAYRMGISVYRSDSLAELNHLLSDNANGAWSFIPANKVKTVPFLKGYYLEFKAAGNAEYRFSNGGLDSSSYLPLRFSSFSGKALPSGNRLSWSIPGEINIDRYELEVAMGNSAYWGNAFKKANEINSRGLSAQEQEYQLDHSGISPGVYYYRIKAIDKEGNFSYSKTIAIVEQSDFEWQVSPNPTSGAITIEYQLPEGEVADALVYNAAGQPVGAFKIQGIGFVNRMNVTLSSMTGASGVYFIRVKGKNLTKLLKVLRY